MDNLEDKLSKLKRLYDQGLITKPIYEKKQQEVLSSGNCETPDSIRKPIREILSKYDLLKNRNSWLSESDSDLLISKLSGIPPEAFKAMKNIHEVMLKTLKKYHYKMEIDIPYSYEITVVALALALKDNSSDFIALYDIENGSILETKLPSVLLLNTLFPNTKKGRLAFKLTDKNCSETHISGEALVVSGLFVKHDFGLAKYFINKIFSQLRQTASTISGKSHDQLSPKPRTRREDIFGPTRIMFGLALSIIGYFLLFAATIGIFFLIIGESTLPKEITIIRIVSFAVFGWLMVKFSKQFKEPNRSLNPTE